MKKVSFTLCKDFTASCQRVVLLEQMWSAIEKEWEKKPVGTTPVWSTVTHQIALAVARGDSSIHLDLPEPVADRLAGQRDEATAVHLGFVKELFPFLDIRPASEEDREAAERGADSLIASAARETEAATTANRALGRSYGGMLHATLDAYSGHLAQKCEPDQARTQANLVKLLKSQLEDQSLTQMTADRIEAVLWFFANRPASKEPIRITWRLGTR